MNGTTTPSDGGGSSSGTISAAMCASCCLHGCSDIICCDSGGGAQQVCVYGSTMSACEATPYGDNESGDGWLPLVILPLLLVSVTMLTVCVVWLRKRRRQPRRFVPTVVWGFAVENDAAAPALGVPIDTDLCPVTVGHPVVDASNFTGRQAALSADILGRGEMRFDQLMELRRVLQIVGQRHTMIGFSPHVTNSLHSAHQNLLMVRPQHHQQQQRVGSGRQSLAWGPLDATREATEERNVDVPGGGGNGVELPNVVVVPPESARGDEAAGTSGGSRGVAADGGGSSSSNSDVQSPHQRVSDAVLGNAGAS